MGLWVQAIGVRGELPTGVAIEPDEDFAPGEPPVVASTDEYEEPGPPTQARAFAEWTERHAPAAVAAERFDEWAQTAYVFAEEGLAYLLGQMGLVDPTTEPPETLDD